MNDYTLALPSEAIWLSFADACTGSIDVIGEHNGLYLVNVRGTVPVEAEQYQVAPVTPLRVWA